MRLNDATHKQSNMGILYMYTCTCICSYNGSVRETIQWLELLTIKSNMGWWRSGYSAVTNLKLLTLCLKITLMLKLEVREAVSHGGRIGLGWYWPVPITVLHTCGVCKSEVTWVARAQAPPSKFDKKKKNLYTILERRYSTPMFFYSPRPEVFVYRGLNISIANLVWGIAKKYW